MNATNAALEAVVLAAQIILESSGETYRAEETAVRMGTALGLLDPQILAFPTGFIFFCQIAGGDSATRVVRIANRSIRLDTIDLVNKISRKVTSGEMDAFAAYEALRSLRQGKPPNAALMVLFFAFSAGFFSMMFGGGIKEFLITTLCGAALQGMMPLYAKLRMPSMLIALVSGALGALLGTTFIRIFGGMQEPIVTGAIMPLLPGLAMTNAVRDSMRGDIISGLARGMDALLCAVLLAAGVAIVMVL